jgi:trans-aconitate 2-methyltransferase
LSANPWSPDQYARFRDQRSQPFFDLLGMVQPQPHMHVADLGCGTGELTQQMHRQLAAADTLGIDTSEAMLAKSSAFAGDGLRFERGDIRAFTPQAAYDLVFSNAALQWVPQHDQLFAQLYAALAPGGQLAVQQPCNGDHPSHATAVLVAAEEPFATALVGHRHHYGTLLPEQYAVLLHHLGFTEQVVRVYVYGHELPSSTDVAEWTKGSLLTDYQRRLTPELYDRFLQRYQELLLAQIGQHKPYFYTFKRILLWARK